MTRPVKVRFPHFWRWLRRFRSWYCHSLSGRSSGFLDLAKLRTAGVPASIPADVSVVSRAARQSLDGIVRTGRDGSERGASCSPICFSAKHLRSPARSTPDRKQAKQRWRGGPDGEKPCLVPLEPPLLMEPLPAYSVAPSLSSRTYRGPPSNPRKSVAWRREDRRETGPRGSSSSVRTQHERWVRVVTSGGSPNPSLRCHRDNSAPYRLGLVAASRKSGFSGLDGQVAVSAAGQNRSGFVGRRVDQETGHFHPHSSVCP